MIRKALLRTGGMATRAAKLLNMSYKTFLYRVEKYGINYARQDESLYNFTARYLLQPYSPRESPVKARLTCSERRIYH